jgi:23S rRNA (pseudouridine1915-N3)-methyltransferase
MKLELWSIGKQHDSSLKEVIEDYTTRINRYCPVKWDIISPPKNAGLLSEIDLKRLEGKLILDKIDKEVTLVVLDEGGGQLNSEGLAAWLTKMGNHSSKRIVFLIGGAFGIDKTVMDRADLVWSLSKLTFPHQLVRLILAEQVYRAFTITRNEKYHHR